MCNFCKEFKLLEDFNKHPRTADNRNTKCKECEKKYKKMYRETNKLKIKKARVVYYKNNKEFVDANTRKNAHKYTKTHTIYMRKYINENIENRLRKNLRKRTWDALNRVGTVSEEGTCELLGCSPLEFKEYLEERFLQGMSWDNYGKLKDGSYGWEIDHIRPCNSFNLTSLEQQRECFHYTNTQPLWACDNRSKSDKWGRGLI